MADAKQLIPGQTRNQFYGIHNEPLMPTPSQIRSQMRQSPINPSEANHELQQQQPQSPSSMATSRQTELEQQSTIVGPSDHYGMHPFTNGDLNGNTKSNESWNLKQPAISNHFQSNQDETKVCVIVDSRTPVIFKIPLPPTRVTLADIKRALPAIDQPSYKYFFKSNDSEFGIVKEEIHEDDSILPTYRNRIVAWIVTPGRPGDELDSRPARSETDTCNLTYSNTSYDGGASSLFTTDMESTSYFTETDDDSICCSNYSETTCDTFISQRKNRKLSKSPSHHHDHHNRAIVSPYRYNRQQDRRDFENMSRSSSPTTSSGSHSDATAVHCLTVHLVLNDENFLGLHIYANSINGIDEGIFVDGVTENSAVALDGNIEPGDKLIQVNDINLEELTNEEAVGVLKDAVIKRGPLKLVVAKFVEANKNVGIINPRDAIHPIDTAAWVAHTQALTIPNIQDQTNSATSSPSFDSNAQDTDFIRPTSANMRLNRGTADIRDIIQHMKMPEVGLTIKDREWLKIHIPQAFLGSELVSWLERNVYGFKSNRDAKKFAAKMLQEGYIKDPISKKSFSSKSYYTFVI